MKSKVPVEFGSCSTVSGCLAWALQVCVFALCHTGVLQNYFNFHLQSQPLCATIETGVVIVHFRQHQGILVFIVLLQRRKCVCYLYSEMVSVSYLP